MNSLFILLTPISILQFTLLLILIHTPPSSTSNDDHYRDCNNLFTCGEIRNIGFPFWGEKRPNGCGHPLLHLTCEGNTSYININDVRYKVLEAKPGEHSLTITRVDYLQGLCPARFFTTSLNTELLVYGSEYKNLTLFYGCPFPNAVPSHFAFVSNCSGGDHVYAQFGSFDLHLLCEQSVAVPVPKVFDEITDATKTLNAIRDGFLVNWIAGVQECEECINSGGVCGYESNKPTCYYRDKDQPCPNFTPDAKEPSSSGLVSKLRI